MTQKSIRQLSISSVTRKTQAGYVVFAIFLCLGGLFVPQKTVYGTTLKLSTLAMQGSPQMDAFHKAASDIKEVTNGKVKLKVYPGGAMGTGDTLFRKIKFKQMDGGSFNVSEAAQYCPDLNVPSLSFLFQNYSEIDRILPVLHKGFNQTFEENGFVVLGYIETGFAYLMSTKPISTVQEIKARNIWVQPEDWVAQLELKYFGVTPKTLSLPQATTGLMTGMVDTVAGPFIVAIGLQWFTKIKYVLDVPLLYTFSVILISKDKFDQIDSQYQSSIKDIFSRYFEGELQKKTREENAEAKKILADKGIQFVKPPDDEVVRIINQMMPAKDAIAEKGIMSDGIIGNTLKKVEVLRDTING